MTEQKEIKDQKLEEKKLEKPVEVEDTENTPQDLTSHAQSGENKEDVKKDVEGQESKVDKKFDSSDKGEKFSPDNVTDIKTAKKTESKIEDKKSDKEDKKPVKPKSIGPKKTEAVVNGRDLRISTKHAVAVCDFIRNKDVDLAIGQLGEVSKKRRAIPMKGEIPHRKGMMSGRYPINAVKDFLKLLKSVKANAMVNELELEKVRIYCMANVASRPRRRFGQGKHKRSHVQIKLVPRVKTKLEVKK